VLPEIAMKERTLLADRLYFGMEPERLRTSAKRVLSRVSGIRKEHARISARNLRQDFELTTIEGQAFVSALVEQGLLRERTTSAGHYRPTRRLAEIARARVVPPLSRARAKMMVEKAIERATLINVRWSRNPLEVETIATFGGYMTRDAEIADVGLGVLLRLRPPERRARFLSILSKNDGAKEIRAAFAGISSYVHVQLVQELRELPRPFAVVFHDDLP
jgi:hypothetical protein